MSLQLFFLSVTGAGGFILQVTFGGAGGNLVDVTERAEVESADAGQQ